MFEHHNDDADRDGQETQLDVPHPYRDVGALEDLFEVDAGEAGQHAGSNGGAEPCQSREENSIQVKFGVCRKFETAWKNIN